MSTGCQKPKPPSSCEPNRCSNNHGHFSSLHRLGTLRTLRRHKVVEKMPLILLAYPMMYSTPDHPITRPNHRRTKQQVQFLHSSMSKYGRRRRHVCRCSSRPPPPRTFNNGTALAARSNRSVGRLSVGLHFAVLIVFALRSSILRLRSSVRIDHFF